MINIVVYGKPRSFESHEYVFGLNDVAASDNSFEEPLLKPVKYKKPVLHYFVREGYAGIEYYHRASGYESSRDGLVFGIALKTDFDFEINKVVENVLMTFWSDFASDLLDNEDRFISPSMLGDLIGTEWSDEEISIVKNSVKQIPFHKPNSGRKICLLVAPKIEQINTVESQLKEYSDVYIADNIDIFKDSINKVLLNKNQANGIICEIKNDKIVPIGDRSKPEQNKKRESLKWGTQKDKEASGVTIVHGGVAKKPDEKKVSDGGGNINPNDQKNNDGKIAGFLKKNRSAIVALLGLCVIVVGVVVWSQNTPIFNDHEDGGSGNEPPVVPGGGSGGGNASSGVGSPAPFDGVSVMFPGHNSPINKYLKISPDVKGTTADKIWYDWDNKDIIRIEKIDDNKIKLSVIKNPNVDTKVNVVAYHNDVEVGRQSYTIAAKEKTTDEGAAPASKNKQYKNIVIQYSKGDETKIYNVGEVISIKVVDNDNGSKTLPDNSGTWSFDSPNVSITNGSEKDSKITIVGRQRGNYTITYSPNSGTKQSAKFIVK